MQRQRDAARKAWAGSGEAATEEVWFDIREETGASSSLVTTQRALKGRGGYCRRREAVRDA